MRVRDRSRRPDAPRPHPVDRTVAGDRREPRDRARTPRLERQIAGSRVIAADAGIGHARLLDIVPELWVGDFDSVPAKAGRPARTPEQNMQTAGITSTRWFDGINLPEQEVDQRSPIRALVVFGHGGNTITRMPEAVKEQAERELDRLERTGEQSGES